MRVIEMTIKSELEHSHSGQLKFVSQRNHIRSDESQILGNERQVAKLSLDRLEEIWAWAWNPMAGLSGPSVRRNVPGRAKSSKMIQPHQVHVCQQGLETVYAPAVASATQCFPVIHRVTPELTVRAEVVRRHAGHKSGSET